MNKTEIKKPIEYDKKKGITKEWYGDNAKKPLVALGTKLGKKAAHDFIKALDMRMQGRDDALTKEYFNKPIVKAALVTQMLFKYLGQDPAFNEVNDPQKPVPIFVCWRNTDGRLQWTSNAFDNFMINEYGMVKQMFGLLYECGYEEIREMLFNWDNLTEKEKEIFRIKVKEAKAKYMNLMTRS